MRIARPLALLLFAILCMLYLEFSWSTVLGDFGGDNAHYLFMARHFSPYAMPSDVTEYFAAQSIYPPLFPYLLGLTGGAESLLMAHLVTTICLLAACGVFFWWLRQEGIGLLVACLALLALMLLPGIYLQTLSIHSENLYLLFSLAALAFVTSVQHQKNTKYWMLMAVLAIAGAYLTRGAGLALVLAWLGWLWLNRVPSRLMFSIAGLLPVILWSLFGSAHSNNYWGQLTHGYQNPTMLVSQAWMQAQYLLTGWLANFGSSRTALIAGFLLLSLGLISALCRCWLRQMDGFYVWVYLAMIVIWPFPAEAQRMVLVIFPVLLWQSIWLLNQLKLKISATRPLIAAVLSLLLLSALPEFALNTQRFLSPLPPGVPEAYRHTEIWYSPNIFDAIASTASSAKLESDLTRLGKIVPENECIFAIKPSIVAYLADRISKAPPAIKTDQITFNRELKSEGCRYFYLLAFASPSYPVMMYPYDRLHDELELIDPITSSESVNQKQTVGLLARLK